MKSLSPASELELVKGFSRLSGREGRVFWTEQIQVWSLTLETVVTENFSMLAVLRPHGAWETQEKVLEHERQVAGSHPGGLQFLKGNAGLCKTVASMRKGTGS